MNIDYNKYIKYKIKYLKLFGGTGAIRRHVSSPSSILIPLMSD